MTKNEFFQYRLSGIISTAAYSSYATLNTFKALSKITDLARKVLIVLTLIPWLSNSRNTTMW